jgi:hypothetical protein
MRALTLPVIEVIYTLIEIEKAVEGDMSFAISHMNQSVELIVWIWRRLEETPICAVREKAFCLNPKAYTTPPFYKPPLPIRAVSLLGRFGGDRYIYVSEVLMDQRYLI